MQLYGNGSNLVIHLVWQLDLCSIASSETNPSNTPGVQFFENRGFRGGSGAGSLGGAQQLTGGRGVVAENFRDLQKPARFSGGGGVVAEIFSDLQKPARFSGGGVVADIFRIPSPETDPIRSRERDPCHTFAHLPRYSWIDKPVWQDTYTNKKITKKKNSI